MEESKFTSDYIRHRRVRHKSIHWQTADSRHGLRYTINQLKLWLQQGRKNP